MLVANGKLFEATVIPSRTISDGTIIKEKHVLQLVVKNFRNLNEFLEIKVKDVKAYSNMIGKEVKIPVRIFVPKTNEGGSYYLTADES